MATADNTVLEAPVLYIVSYKYDRPSPAGPFRGRTEVPVRLAKGDSFRAVFGMATVVSCRIKKAKENANAV